MSCGPIRNEVDEERDSGNQPKRLRKHYTSRFQGAFEHVLCDEGHRLRNAHTRNAVAVRLLRAGFLWLITATPLLNAYRDMVGLLHLLWRDAWREDLSDQDQQMVKSLEELEIFTTCETWGQADPKWRLLLEPHLFNKLFESGTVDVRKHCQMVENLLCLRRSHASKIPHSSAPEKFVLLNSVVRRHWVINNAHYVLQRVRSEIRHG